MYWKNVKNVPFFQMYPSIIYIHANTKSACIKNGKYSIQYMENTAKTLLAMATFKVTTKEAPTFHSLAAHGESKNKKAAFPVPFLFRGCALKRYDKK